MNTINTTIDHDGASEAQAIAKCLADLEALKSAHPAFWTQLDAIDTECCSRAELVALMDAAPTASARLYLLSKFSTRLTVAGLTGRRFS